MRWPLQMLRDKLGGSWDGDDAQAHGLVSYRGRALKIELTRAEGRVRCHIFEAGAVIAAAEDEDLGRAVGGALRQV